MRALAIGFVLVVFGAPAMAQTDVDPRWSGWLGCWSLVTEDERDDGPAPVTAAIDRVRGFGSDEPSAADDVDRPRLCVAPAPGGVTLTTQSKGAVVFEQTVVADGVERPVTGACHGTRRSEWSLNGRILFSRADLTCEDGTHSGSSLTLLATDGSWVDVEAVRAGTQEGLVVRRYRRLDAPQSSAWLAGAGFTLANVQEASTRVPPAAIEAALVESQATFDLDTRRVVALADAGVPDRVIDMVVALSYPERFIVERNVPPLQARAIDPFTPLPYDPWRDGDLWRYGYAPFGYLSPVYATSSDRFYEQFYPAIPGVIVVSGAPLPTVPPSGAAPRAVNDLGYTRARTRDPEPSAAVRRTTSTRSDGGVMTSGPSSTTASSSGGGSSDSGGGGGGASVSPRGYSDGDSGGSGRTAVPR